MPDPGLQHTEKCWSFELFPHRAKRLQDHFLKTELKGTVPGLPVPYEIWVKVCCFSYHTNLGEDGKGGLAAVGRLQCGG